MGVREGVVRMVLVEDSFGNGVLKKRVVLW